MLVGLAALACGTEAANDGDAIVIGAALPFTGDQATIGQNLEQALLLAIEDVNASGGVDGRRLRLETRDSNSGSDRGLEAVLDLLYVEEVPYLIGPEENALAREVVRDVDGLAVLNILPGAESPTIRRVGRQGGWLRLTPGAPPMGYALATLASNLIGARSTNILVTRDDFNQWLASEYGGYYVNYYRHKIPRTTALTQGLAEDLHTRDPMAVGDRTLLLSNPVTAAKLVTNYAFSGKEVNWILGPTLRTPGLLVNIPPNALDGSFGISPTLSLVQECEEAPEGRLLKCQQENADQFADHYAARWHDQPFPAAHFYYDSVLLLAMGLQYAAATGDPEPTASDLHDLIVDMSTVAEEQGRWNDLGTVMDRVSQGVPVALTGAATRYEFNTYGEAQHAVVDVWSVSGQSYVEQGALSIAAAPY